MSDEDCTPVGDTIEYWLLCADGQPTLEQCLADAQAISQDYIWHRQPFVLQSKDLPIAHMYGCTTFGVCAEDEWLVVGILWQLSRLHPSLVVRIRDSDGDPLLIEAAEQLPAWFDEEISARNRTYIHNGYVHLIPHPVSGINAPYSVPIVDTHKTGADLVRKYMAETRATDISRVIEHRCKKATAWQAVSRHSTQVLVPLSLAHVLDRHAHTLPHAVDAFLERCTPAEAQACRTLPTFGASGDVNELVPCRVTMTRHLYAMLAQHAFVPDKRCSVWPRTSPATTAPVQARRLNDGYKLACGYEILCNERAGTSNGAAVDSRTWKKYAKRLQTSGYFGDELPGSKKYVRLESQARQHLAESVGGKNPSHFESARTVLDSVAAFRALDSDTRAMEEGECRSALLPDDDTCDWMQVSADHLQMDNIDELVQPIKHLLDETAPAMKRPSRIDILKKGAAASSSRSRSRHVEDDDDVNLCDEGMAALDEHFMHDNTNAYNSSDTESYGDEDLNIDLDEKSLRELKSFHTSMRSYMQSMDDELETSTVRHSQIISHPIKLIPGTSTAPKAVKLHKLPEAVQSPSQGGSYVPTKTLSSDSINDIDDDALFTPVDIDRNLVLHLMNARDAQQSVDGPLTSLVAMAGQVAKKENGQVVEKRENGHSSKK